MVKISPFDFVNAIHYTKENLIVDDWSEKQYNPFVVNKSLSFGADTVIPANEMNSRPHLEKRLQFDFLINTIRPRKRFNKWLKAEKIEDLELVKQYYNYNTEKALQALRILSPEQINTIKERLNTGGLTHGT
ncbi:DNA polymerase [bacterium]|nr:DNA polymerase [bacterium]